MKTKTSYKFSKMESPLKSENEKEKLKIKQESLDSFSETIHKNIDEENSESSMEDQDSNVSFFDRDWLPCLSQSVKNRLRLRLRQMVTFILLSSAYAATYLLRKPFGIIKQEVLNEFGVDITIFGWLEFTMFLPYSILSIGFWNVGTRIGPRKTLGFGLLIASAATSLMGTVKSLMWMFALFFISGTAQALCWPASCTLLASWFSTKIRNTVIGAFGTTCFFGGASGTFLVVYLNEIYDWRGVFLWPSLLVAFRGVIVLMMARRPAYHGLIVPGQEEEEKGVQKEDTKTLSDIWKFDLVPEISLSLLCLKFVRYGIMMWLPLYLQHDLGYGLKTAGIVSAAFEAGGALGSIGTGLLLDWFINGNALFASCISIGVSSSFLTLLLIYIDQGKITLTFLLVCAGAANCGSDLVLAGSAINKLVDPHGPNSSVLSVINGVGSLGIVLEGPLISYTIGYLGYRYMIPLFVAFSISGTLLSYKAHCIQAKKMYYYSANNNNNDPETL